MKRPAAATINDEAIDDEQGDRADDCRSQLEMSKNSSIGSAEQSSREEAAEQRSRDTDDRSHDPAARVVARQAPSPHPRVARE